MPIIHEQEEIRPEILVSFAFKVSKFFFFYIADVSNTYVHCNCVLETVTLGQFEYAATSWIPEQPGTKYSDSTFILSLIQTYALNKPLVLSG